MKLYNDYASETNIYEYASLSSLFRGFPGLKVLIWTLYLWFGCILRVEANFLNYDENLNTGNMNGMIAAQRNCPKRCVCPEVNELTCENIEMERVPSSPNEWPSHFEVITLRNISGLVTIDKNAFRPFKSLRHIFIVDCPELDLIDKFAFKDLQQLRLISISGNKKLRELYKNSFSAIGNDQSLSIHIKKNALQRIRAMTFKNANNLRELMVEDECFQVENFAFAAVQKVDFLVLRGSCFVDENAFQNTSRVHNLNILDSTLDIKRRTFAGLYHVNQIQLRDNRIGTIEEDAFGEMFTVGSVHLQSNRIQRIAPCAFADAENLGTLVISYNTIRGVLDSPECLHNAAHKFVFTENTLQCACEMRWIQFHHYHRENQNPIAILSENYCGREEAFKALSYYQPLGCPPLRLASPFQPQHDLESATAYDGKKNNNGRSGIIGSQSQRSSGLEKKPSIGGLDAREAHPTYHPENRQTLPEDDGSAAMNGHIDGNEVLLDPDYFDRINSKFLWFMGNGAASSDRVLCKTFMLLPAVMSAVALSLRVMST